MIFFGWLSLTCRNQTNHPRFADSVYTTNISFFSRGPFRSQLSSKVSFLYWTLANEQKINEEKKSRTSK